MVRLTCRSNAELGVTSVTLPQLTHNRWWWCSVRSSASSKRGELVVRRDAAHHAGGLEVDQVAVGRAARQLRQAVRDVADADRVAGVRQQVHELAAARRVAQVGAAQARLDELVQALVVLSRHRDHLVPLPRGSRHRALAP